MTSIGDDAFNGCTGFTSVTIPDSVTSIGEYAFYNCYKLYEVYNKSDLNIVVGSKENGYVAYYAKNVYTDESGESKLHTIDDYIFYADGDDIDLLAYVGDETELTLPSDYEGKSYIIADRAFYGCSSLTSISSMNTTPPSVGGSWTFYKVNKSIPLYVPKQSVEAYKSAEGWKDFTNIIGGYVVKLVAENGTVSGIGVYEENAEVTLTATPNEGYRFVKWSDGVEDATRNFVITSDIILTAGFVKQYSVTVSAENGTITGAGVHDAGAEVTLTATPNEGYRFVKWSDGVEDATRTITVTEDVELTALFEVDNSPISDVEADNVSIRLVGNRLVVEGADSYSVYAVNGQCLGMVESLERGVYIVVADGVREKIIVR